MIEGYVGIEQGPSQKFSISFISSQMPENLTFW